MTRRRGSNAVAVVEQVRLQYATGRVHTLTVSPGNIWIQEALVYRDGTFGKRNFKRIKRRTVMGLPIFEEER